MSEHGLTFESRKRSGVEQVRVCFQENCLAAACVALPLSAEAAPASVSQFLSKTHRKAAFGKSNSLRTFSGLRLLGMISTVKILTQA